MRNYGQHLVLHRNIERGDRLEQQQQLGQIFLSPDLAKYSYTQTRIDYYFD